MLLRHLHIPNITSYTHASILQATLVSKLLAHKANPAQAPAIPPTVITAQFNPVYTCGRREVGSVTSEQQSYLRADGKAEFHEALRGGQTTYHGPGQLVAYPILDLKRHGLSARCYVHLLEETVMKTCAAYGVATRQTDNPGVWVDEDRKICALGVHLRRNVTSHGVGLNVNTDLWWFDRIVACGLENKRVTSLAAIGVLGRSVEEVGDLFVKSLAKGLKGIDSIERIQEPEVD